VEKIGERLKAFGYTVDQKNELEIINLLKSRLDVYIQKKADFMAEIATEPLTTSKSMRFYDEVILYLTKNTLLMDAIGANEGVRYKDRFEIPLKVNFEINGSPLSASYSDGKQYSCCYSTKGGNEAKKKKYPYTGYCDCIVPKELYREGIENTDKDVNIALPGLLGEFAFYSFLENFIRNAVKHNRQELEEQKDLEINIEVKDYDDEFYCVEVWDNVTKPKKKVKGKYLYKMLDGRIREPIVDDEGKLRKGAWGIAEMQVMATLMRGSVDFVDMRDNLNVKCRLKDGH